MRAMPFEESAEDRVVDRVVDLPAVVVMSVDDSALALRFARDQFEQSPVLPSDALGDNVVSRSARPKTDGVFEGGRADRKGEIRDLVVMTPPKSDDGV